MVKFIKLFISILIIFTSLSILQSLIIRDNGLMVGLPFMVYEELKISGNDFINRGWYPMHIIYNLLIYVISTIVIIWMYSIYKREN